MKLFTLAAALALCAAPSFAGSLHAPTKPSQTAPAQPAASDDSGSWMDQVAGKKFFAVDGSTVMLTPNDGGFTLNTVTSDGTGHDTTFNMLSDTLGSITEGDDKTVTGVFHVSGDVIEANFADGRTESLASNAAGGLTVLLNAPDAKSWCMKWYPQGHGFEDSDKKEALAEYATKLGLAPAPRDHVITSASCIEGGTAAPMQQTAAISPPKHGLVQPINVRTSQVHLIDTPVAPEPAQIIAPPMLTTPAPMKTADLGPQHPLLQNHGASSCLKIDNDGSSWGFRNGCDYGVQFAWCLQKGTDRATACGTGTGSGSLASNGFVALMPGNAVVDADNQFRWVACNGGSDVSAQLDRSDPPAGRCVITNQQ
jgi:hypothetical protein